MVIKTAVDKSRSTLLLRQVVVSFQIPSINEALGGKTVVPGVWEHEPCLQIPKRRGGRPLSAGTAKKAVKKIEKK
jgi:hypothetical protein